MMKRARLHWKRYFLHWDQLPEDDEIKELIWEAIEETLSELPEEQRSVFVANEFEGMSFKEISEKTGTGVNTLISRKRYAVLALRERLNELYKLLTNNIR